MGERSSSVCAICHRALRDARLLDCVHSFCKLCLDDLDLRTGHAREISCPLCRSKTLLPNNGAGGLPKDITVEEDRPCECDTCKEDGKDTKPELWCTACDVGFCRDHGVSHLMANSEHVIKPFSEANSGKKASRSSAGVRHCREHDCPLAYFCKQCKKAVCGDCMALGEHHGHKPIVAIKEIAKDLKQQVERKMTNLKTVCLARVEKALSEVDKVTSELSSQAEEVRSKIWSSRQSVLDAVELVVQQKLAEVDDLEEVRLKHLGSQEDELKQQADGLKSALRFGEKLLEVDMETEDVSHLLLAIEKRADELEKAGVEEEPVEHAGVYFETLSEEEVLAKASELVGAVRPPSATASLIQGAEGSVSEDGLVTVRMMSGPDGRYGFSMAGGLERGIPVRVSRVTAGSPAAEARPKLREGDTIIAVNGTTVTEFPQEQAFRAIRSASKRNPPILVLTVKPVESDSDSDSDSDNGSSSDDEPPHPGQDTASLRLNPLAMDDDN